jgi:hypothetical protein
MNPWEAVANETGARKFPVFTNNENRVCDETGKQKRNDCDHLTSSKVQIRPQIEALERNLALT